MTTRTRQSETATGQTGVMPPEQCPRIVAHLFATTLPHRLATVKAINRACGTRGLPQLAGGGGIVGRECFPIVVTTPNIAAQHCIQSHPGVADLAANNRMPHQSQH